MARQSKPKLPKLTAANYYDRESNLAYWSASQVKAFLKCPACAMAELKGEYQRPASTALLVGNYIDSYFEGPKHFDAYKERYKSQLFKKNGEPYSDVQKANEMIVRATGDELFMEYMRGRKQTIVTGRIEGVPFKAKLDVFRKGERIVDLKTVKDFEPVYAKGQGKLHPIDFWEWPMQMAIYQELVRQKFGTRLPVYLAIITKQDVPDLEIVEIPQEKLDAEMEYLKEKIFYFDGIKQGIIEADRCEDCAYCRSTHKLTAPKSYNEIMLGD